MDQDAQQEVQQPNMTGDMFDIEMKKRLKEQIVKYPAALAVW